MKFFKFLKKYKSKITGRNHKGLITVRHRGGGCKRFFRKIDFFFSFLDIPGIILNIEKEPNRSCFIALVFFKNGFFSYILSHSKLSVGSIVLNTVEGGPCKLNNSLPLDKIYVGSPIFNIELYEGKGGILCRSAGSFGVVIKKFNFFYNFVLVRLKSGEEYFLKKNCFASVGIASNIDFRFLNLKKAGIKRYLGFRPKVRGVAMNPIDHPHGGGEGKTSGGRPSVSAWSFLTKSRKKKNKKLNKFIFKSKNF